MKKSMLIMGFTLQIAAIPALAQVAINTDASQPNASAMLDIKTTTKGLLVPRLSSAQRVAIVSPAEGLSVFDTDTKSFWFFINGGGWQQIPGAGGGSLTLPFASAVNFPTTLFQVTNTGTEAGAGNFQNNNPGNPYPVFNISTNGLGVGLSVTSENESSTTEALFVSYNGAIRSAASIRNANSLSTGNTLDVRNHGIGSSNRSIGNAGNFVSDNPNGNGGGVRGEVNSRFTTGGVAGVFGIASGTGGYGGYFEQSSATGDGYGLGVLINGLGIAATIHSSNPENIYNAFVVSNAGKGVAGTPFFGNAASFINNNPNGQGSGVFGQVNTNDITSAGAGVYGTNAGNGGYAGYFRTPLASSTARTLFVENKGFGKTALFVNSNSSVLQSAVYISTGGSATALELFKSGTGNYITCTSGGGDPSARIDINGRGFFNGGTQTGGADLAEAFGVEGNSADYEPGDVLVISTQTDRTVLRSNSAYSTLVAGVYATKPGVLMTEEFSDNDLEGKVPMGVIGVIPTKVCDQNGSIQRGDMLVSSDRPGFAMKADLNQLKPGQAIGKALEEFNDSQGKIKVLVNVR